MLESTEGIVRGRRSAAAGWPGGFDVVLCMELGARSCCEMRQVTMWLLHMHVNTRPDTHLDFLIRR